MMLWRENFAAGSVYVHRREDYNVFFFKSEELKMWVFF